MIRKTETLVCDVCKSECRPSQGGKLTLKNNSWGWKIDLDLCGGCLAEFEVVVAEKTGEG